MQFVLIMFENIDGSGIVTLKKKNLYTILFSSYLICLLIQCGQARKRKPTNRSLMSRVPTRSYYEECFERETRQLETHTLRDSIAMKEVFDRCSVPESRIIGGEETAFREYPWMVSQNHLTYIYRVSQDK